MTRFVTAVMKIAKEIYGEENVKLVRLSRGDTPAIDLCWPEITIRNRTGATHRIKGMHVCLPLENDEKKFAGRIWGWRDTLSFVENRSGYAHSHLPGTSLAQFCTGSDGINNVWAQVCLESTQYGSDSYKDLFRGFMFLLDSFIQYESLEGVPHRRIANIGLGRNRAMNMHYVQQKARNILEGIDKKLIKLAIDFNTAKVEVVETDELHAAMLEFVTDSQFHAYRMPNGTYMGTERIQAADGQVLNGSRDNRAPYPYEGNAEHFMVTIEAHGDQNDYSRERPYVHPRITDKVKQTIEKYAEDQIREWAVAEHADKTPDQYKAFYSDEEARQIAPDRQFGSTDYGLSYRQTDTGVVWSPILEDERREQLAGTGDSGDNSVVPEVA